MNMILFSYCCDLYCDLLLIYSRRFTLLAWKHF